MYIMLEEKGRKKTLNSLKLKNFILKIKKKSNGHKG